MILYSTILYSTLEIIQAENEWVVYDKQRVMENNNKNNLWNLNK